jgi:phosphate transport system permease protein
MTLALFVLLLAAVAYVLARQRANAVAGGRPAALHSRPVYHAWYAALVTAVPGLLIWLLWLVFGEATLRMLVEPQLPPEVLGQPPFILNAYLDDVARLARGEAVRGELTPAMEQAAAAYGRLLSIGTVISYGAALALAIAGAALALRHVAPGFPARPRVEAWVTYALLAAAAVSILTTAGIVFSVLFESIRFFERVPITEFLFGLHWSPQTAIRADQVGSSGSFGAVPLFAGTLVITVIALLVSGPLGLLSAIYLAEYAGPKFRSLAKPILELLAGIPTVVYGFFAALTVAPFIRELGAAVGLTVSSESALAAGGVMGIMIIPFVSSLSDDALTAVPMSLREASLGLGATKAETVRKVVLPAALPGVIAGFLLAISRAIGETMIVVMAAGLAANLTGNPFEAVTTVTVQIVTLLVGDQEFDSAKTLAAFALGLVLFVGTLVLNIVALYVLKTYREKYD